MTLRLFHDYFIGETTTISYDYSRTCYDYFSPLLAIGRKPERDTAVAVNGSAPPAALLLLDCQPGGGCQVDPA